MKRKGLILSILAPLFFLLFGIYLINQTYNNNFAKFVKDNTPQQIKKFLKNTIFYIPITIRDNKKLKAEVRELNKIKFNLELNNFYLLNKNEFGTFSKKVIKSKKNKYLLKNFIVPFYNENLYGNKKSGYIDFYKDNLVLAFTSGKIIFIDKFELINNNNFKFREIENNLDNLKLFDQKIRWTGIKDIKIFDDKIIISVTEEIKNDCYATTLLYSEILSNSLNFEHLFRPDECVDINKNNLNAFKYFNGYQTGGRIEKVNDDIFFTLGDYNDWKLPQNKKSVFGKILKINLESKNFEIVSIGHRNQQGLKYLSSENTLIATEHGPKGGDEINLIDLNNLSPENYGWPISSYGDHYDVVPINKYTKKFAPLHKSHKSYDFIEPIFYFKEGIGISEIIKNYFSSEDSFFLTSLKKKKIYQLLFKNNYKNSEITDQIEIGERIRDIIYDYDTENYFLYLENTPNISVLKIN